MDQKVESTSKTGFVCPDWAIPYWNQTECTITPCTDGTHVVLDHSLNGVEIFIGTRKECANFLNPPMQ